MSHTDPLPDQSKFRVEISADRREVTIHVTPDGIAFLREALDDAERGGKVFLGDKDSGLLIIRPDGWGPSEPDDEIIQPGTYELNNGHTLHVWISGTEDEPEMWACQVYDHGPMCRLCQEVDGVLNACLLNAIDGRMECDQDQDGQFRFKVTKAGEDAVRNMINRTEDEES